MTAGWEWDETLFQGRAPYYMRGRPPYAPGLTAALVESLGLDGRGRVLDVGCGPGVLALLLAPHCAEVVGVDPDRGMVAEAARRAAAVGIANVQWRCCRAEDLPPELGTFQAATFAQSFHWMDQPGVAAAMIDRLAPGGWFVHVADDKTPHPDRPPLPTPAPPYAVIQALIDAWLGPVRRAGRGHLPLGTPGGEAAVLAAAGYRGPMRRVLPGGGVWRRDADDVVAWVWSRSGSAPHLFGDRRPAFEAELRALLAATSPAGDFADWLPDTEVRLWQRPDATPDAVPPAGGGEAWPPTGMSAENSSAD